MNTELVDRIALQVANEILVESTERSITQFARLVVSRVEEEQEKRIVELEEALRTAKSALESADGYMELHVWLHEALADIDEVLKKG